MEQDLCFVLVSNGHLPHPCLDRVSREGWSCEAARNGLERTWVGSSVLFKDRVSGVATAAETMEDGLFEPDHGCDGWVDMQWVIVPGVEKESMRKR